MSDTPEALALAELLDAAEAQWRDGPSCSEQGEGIHLRVKYAIKNARAALAALRQGAQPAEDDLLTVAYMAGRYDKRKAESQGAKPAGDDLAYTAKMGAAADAYINRMGGRSSMLPARFRWEECLAEMFAARAPHPEAPPQASTQGAEEFVLVPKEPTPEMRNAFHAVTDDEKDLKGAAGSRWAAMLAAAPQQKKAEGV